MLHSAKADDALNKVLQRQLPPPEQLVRDASDRYETSALNKAAWDRAKDAALAAQAGPFKRVAPDAAAWPERGYQQPVQVCAPPLKRSDAGAVWCTWRREDTQALCAWLMQTAHERDAAPSEAAKAEILEYPPVCKLGEIYHAVHSQAFFLMEKDLARLKHDTGIEPWVFYQADREAVFIPAGCPHQVRNLRSCIKVALDFVSPEASREVVALSSEFAAMGTEEKLQGKAMLVHGAKRALDILDPPKERPDGGSPGVACG
jgi:JmjC domain, hydroxylase